MLEAAWGRHRGARRCAVASHGLNGTGRARSERRSRSRSDERCSCCPSASLPSGVRSNRCTAHRWLLFPGRAAQQDLSSCSPELSGRSDMQELTRLVGDRLDTLLTTSLCDPLRSHWRRLHAAGSTWSSGSARLRAQPDGANARPLGRRRAAAGPRPSHPSGRRSRLFDVAVLVPIGAADLSPSHVSAQSGSGDIYRRRSRPAWCCRGQGLTASWP